jgi:hypothetical protein
VQRHSYPTNSQNPKFSNSQTCLPAGRFSNFPQYITAITSHFPLLFSINAGAGNLKAFSMENTVRRNLLLVGILVKSTSGEK